MMSPRSRLFPILQYLFAAIVIGCAPTKTPTPPVSYTIDSVTIQQARDQCDSLQGADEQLCLELVDERLSTFESLKTSNLNQQQAQNISDMFAKALSEDATMLGSAAASPEVICQARDIGIVDCAKLVSILALYDTTLGQLALRDIDSLYKDFGFVEDQEILLGCGSGLWVAFYYADLEVANAANLLTGLSSTQVDHMLDGCVHIAGSLGGGITPSGGGGGYSGVTGFDPLDSLTECGMSDNASEFIDFVEWSFDMYRAFAQECSSNQLDTIKEGDDSSGSPPKPPAPPKPPENPQPGPDSTVEETKVETTKNEDNTTTTTTTDYYTDQTVVKTTVTTDGQGNVIETTTATATSDSEGNVNFSEVTVDGESNITEVQSGTMTKNENGDWVGEITVTSADGTADVYRVVRTQDGSVWWNQGPPPIGEPAPLHNLDDWIKGCDQDVCGTCKDLANVMPQTLEDCTFTGADSYACQRFARAAGCCEGSTGSPLTIPNPLGDYTCAGQADIADAGRDACMDRCSVAYSEDCVSNCNSTESPGICPFSMLDRICQSAISEACFSQNGSDFVSPDNPVIGPRPLPTVPDYERIHSLVPVEDPQVTPP